LDVVAASLNAAVKNRRALLRQTSNRPWLAPRWLAYEVKFDKLKLPANAPFSSQERPDTSPMLHAASLMIERYRVF
jgi:hypothetical protein